MIRRLNILVVAVSWLTCLPCIRAADQPVKVTPAERKPYVTLENGVVSVDIDKQSGNIRALRKGGKSLLMNPGYFNWVAEENHQIAGGVYALRTDPSTNGGATAEVSVTLKYAGTGAAFDLEIHHVLLRGDSGFYTYVVMTHPRDYPAAEFAQARYVFRVNPDLFDFINIDDQRRFPMPPPDAPHKSMGPKESMLITDGPFKGYMADKYHLFTDAGDHFVHGWSGTKSGLGCWILYGSTEDQNGGPTKQHNTAHFGSVLLKILTCCHYGAAPVNVPTGEWQKIYGPWMVYVNQGENVDALWADAKRKAQVERAAWPYAWMNHPAYPLSAERGRVSGKLIVDDPQDPHASSASAWVGLAAPSPDWQQQSNGYQFWVRADQMGRFEIPHVRAGHYTLYAFVDGVMDEYRADNIDVKPGGELQLGDLRWRPARFGRQLWQIGIPDRTAREFRHGDDYREWGLWQQYPIDFPNGVHFVVGKSSERTDWNYAQVNVQKDGQWVGTGWEILFDVNEPVKAGKCTLRLALAAAQNSTLRISLNGQSIETLRELGQDNAMMRAGIHGQYCERDVTFDSSLLKAGTNSLTLDQLAGNSPQKNVMYDCIRLETPD